MPAKPAKSQQEHIEQRSQLVFEHRRKGGQINRKFAIELSKDGFDDGHGFPVSTDVLFADYQRFVRNQVIFHRKTYESFGTLQLMRLESNLELLDSFVEDFKESREEGYSEGKFRFVLRDALSVLKETRETIGEISKLVGANAPTEVVITQRLESEVQQMVAMLQQGLPEDVFTQVAQCLAKGMGMVKERVISEEPGAIAGYEVVGSEEIE